MNARSEKAMAMVSRKIFKTSLTETNWARQYRCVQARNSLLLIAAQGATELDGGEAEFVAEVVGGFGELFEFFAAVGFQEVELLRAVGGGGGGAEEADFAFDVAVVPEEIEEDGEDIGVELRGLGKRFGTGVGFEAGVTD